MVLAFLLESRAQGPPPGSVMGGDPAPVTLICCPPAFPRCCLWDTNKWEGDFSPRQQHFLSANLVLSPEVGFLSQAHESCSIFFKNLFCIGSSLGEQHLSPLLSILCDRDPDSRTFLFTLHVALSSEPASCWNNARGREQIPYVVPS